MSFYLYTQLLKKTLMASMGTGMLTPAHFNFNSKNKQINLLSYGKLIAITTAAKYQPYYKGHQSKWFQSSFDKVIAITTVLLTPDHLQRTAL